MKSYMSEEFHDWLDQCPVQYFLDKSDKDGSTYSFNNDKTED